MNKATKLLAAALVSGMAALPLWAQNDSSSVNDLRPQNQRQNNNTIRPANLSSGRLSEIRWRESQLVIDGQRYDFDDDQLRVFFQDGQVTLLDLAANALIRYQTSQRGGRAVVIAIWVESADSLIPS